MLAEGGATTEDRVRWAFRCVLARDPDDAEINELIVLAARQRARLAGGAIDAAEVATGKKEPLNDIQSGTELSDLATATVIARVLLNLDETITKE